MAITFWLAAACILYVLFGYPLSLLLRRESLPVFAPGPLPAVSVLLAVKNGERWLASKLDSLLNLDYPPELLDILVISDGSTDATESIANQYHSREHRIRLLAIEPRGKSGAISAALDHVKGDILFMTDVRQALAQDSLKHLVRCFGDPAIGVVSGELRFRHAASLAEQNLGLYWRFECWLRLKLSRIDSMFGASGSIYAIRRHLTTTIPGGILLDDMYLPLFAFFKGYRLIVEPAATAWDHPTAGQVEFRRKVRTLAGNYQLLKYYPQLLNPFVNRLWLDYISYKFARLILPHLLILLFVSTFWLADPWRFLFLAAQLGVYALALLDRFLSDRAKLKRLTSPAWAFLSMMAAAFCAQAIFFVEPSRLWRPTNQIPGHRG